MTQETRGLREIINTFRAEMKGISDGTGPIWEPFQKLVEELEGICDLGSVGADMAQERPKRRYSCWLSEATREKLVALAKGYGTQAEVIAVAIDRLYTQEIGQRSEAGDQGE